MNEWAAFWPNLLATLVGAFLGFGLALLLDRMRESRERNKDKKKAAATRDARESLFLRNAIWSVEENMELARQIRRYVQPESRVLPVLAFKMNTLILDEAILELSRLCDDSVLLWETGNFRYQLDHLNGKLLVMQHYGVQTFRTPTVEEVRQLRKTVVDHAELIVSAGDDLLPKLRSRLQRFETRTRPLVRPPRKLSPGEPAIAVKQED